MICFRCQAPLLLEAGQKISRREECPECFFSLHSCKMCQFYNPSLYNECSETIAHRVLDKEKANFCDYFKLANFEGHSSDRAKLFEKANLLFKKE